MYIRIGIENFTILLLLLISSCNPKPPSIDLPFETIEKDENSGVGDRFPDFNPAMLVISSVEETALAKGLIRETTIDMLEHVNYTDCFVVFVYQGRKLSTRYGVNIENITRDGTKIEIYAQFSEPKPEEPRGDMMTSPYHIVQVEKKGKDWGQEFTFNLVVKGATLATLTHSIP